MTTGTAGWADDLHLEPADAASAERLALSVWARTSQAYPLPK